ncbi:MAG: 2-oxo acid dehydrogenase subunit E2 [Clostridia bacterium]|nr:2-oxo acid dehydrogenase subunit E2 [Clostridia bacterium]
MFGRRADGKVIKGLSGFFKVIPYIMPTRVDATNYSEMDLDCRPISQYVREKGAEGINISFMSVLIAAYVRSIAEKPDINRFVVNKRIYARNHIAVCFVVLKADGNQTGEETVVKIICDPKDTVFDIAEKVNRAIDDNRKAGSNNATDKLVNLLFRIPFLAGFLVGCLKLLDRYGLLPRAVINASPFHTSMFITNMASIKMNSIYHHCYNFGTTGVFISMGTKVKKESIRHDGGRVVRQIMPLKIATDERICSGAAYAHHFYNFQKYLANPAVLETPPETVNKDLK